MPRVRRRPLDRIAEFDCERTRYRLLEGHDFAFLDGPDLDADQLRAAWEDLRDELLTGHIRAHPGTRPWAWWEYDAPEPRRQAGDGPEPLPGSGLYYGAPRCYRQGLPPADMYETEAAYLDRLGLLTDDERGRLAEAPAP